MFELELSGTVGGPGFNFHQVKQALDAAGSEPVQVTVASHGGDTANSAAIYALLKAYPGQLTTTIRFAGSAAVLPALAAGRRSILAGGSLFFHRCWEATVGTSRDLFERAAHMAKLDLMDAEIYAEASGQSVETCLDLMDESAVLDADQALRLGFVHEILDQPGGEQFPGEIWHNTARSVVNLFREDLRDRTPAAGLARAETVYQAVMLTDYPIAPVPPGGHPLRSSPESTVLRTRHTELLSRLDRRLLSFSEGFGPNPRTVPIAPTWRCDCGAVNFHPPGHAGRATPCNNCKGDTHDKHL